MEASKFWAARDAWTAATQARQATSPRSKGRFRRPTLDEQSRKWSINASRYLANRPKVLAATVAPPDMAPPVLELLEALPAALYRELDSRLTSVMLNAFREWPVSSGFSKSALFLSFLPKDATFEAAAGDAAPYSPLIKGNPARKLIGAPARVASEEAIQAAMREVSIG